MSKVEKVRLPYYYQGKEEGTYPRMLRKYSNPHNPTYKSDQFSLAITHSNSIKPTPKVVHPESQFEKPKELPKQIELQSLDIATKQFEQSRRSPMALRRPPQELSMLTSNFSGRRTPRLQLRNMQQLLTLDSGRVNKARSSLGRYNDASVYEWQSKPYNIISNTPKEVGVLRVSRFRNPEQPLNKWLL